MKKVFGRNENFPISSAILHDCKYEMEIGGNIGIGDSIEEQTKYALDCIVEELERVGWDLNNLIKMRIFLTTMEDYEGMNKAYTEYFQGYDYPARFGLSVVELPAGSRIEIESKAVGDTIQE
ncbi:RidA family protein [Candidatus Gracilibacteria bacterium]|nr:RidA family protein [Candidatus Gracilibacteria bacterium]